MNILEMKEISQIFTINCADFIKIFSSPWASISLWCMQQYVKSIAKHDELLLSWHILQRKVYCDVMVIIEVRAN